MDPRMSHEPCTSYQEMSGHATNRYFDSPVLKLYPLIAVDTLHMS